MDQRQTIHPRQGYQRRDNRFNGNRGPKGAKGHDAILKELQESGAQVQVIMSHGESLFGKIVARDKFTVSLLLSTSDYPRVIYKHAIESFQQQANEVVAQ